MYYIKYWRQKGGLTQAELAERVKVHTNTVNRWERGHREPRAKDIKKLCQEFGISETDLLNGPPRTELAVNFFWECDHMSDSLSIKANQFSWGFRNDGMLLIAGALPWDMSVDDILTRIKAELIAAKEAKKVKDNVLKDTLKKEAAPDDRQVPDDGANKGPAEGA